MKQYLLSFNLVSFLAWLLYFAYFISHRFELDENGLLLLCIAQLAAVLEVFHALFRWSKSPFSTTLIQVASRIFILVLIYILFPIAADNILYKMGIVMVSVAWSITECVRYSYYFYSLLGKQFVWLSWARYSFFLVLYPIGGSGEILIGISQLQLYDYAISAFNVLTFFVLLSYVVFFPKLYRYMLSQRKKKLGEVIKA